MHDVVAHQQHLLSMQRAQKRALVLRQQHLLKHTFA